MQAGRTGSLLTVYQYVIGQNYLLVVSYPATKDTARKDRVNLIQGFLKRRSFSKLKIIPDLLSDNREAVENIDLNIFAIELILWKILLYTSRQLNIRVCMSGIMLVRSIYN